MDSLEMAQSAMQLKNSSSEVGEGEAEESETRSQLDSMKEGVDLIQLKLASIFRKFEISQIETSGLFDPNEHEGVAAIPNKEHKNLTILDVQTKGYKLKNRVLRAAKVIYVKNDWFKRKK